MKKNYYDILQVNKNASPEIVEKAYKILVKKYHPDLQTSENKHQAEEILKEINEAYDVLSDPQKRQEFDESLIENTISQEEKPKQTYQNQNTYNYEQELQNARNKAYHDAYIQDMKNRGYKIRYKKTFEDYLHSAISLGITILILMLLWQIPSVRNFFIKMYHENPIIKSLVDIFLGMFSF